MLGCCQTTLHLMLMLMLRVASMRVSLLLTEKENPAGDIQFRFMRMQPLPNDIVAINWGVHYNLHEQQLYIKTLGS